MSSPVRRAGRATLPFLPGAVVFVLLYGVTILRGGSFLYDERFLIMQALDTLALDRYPVAVLASLHTQPPLMNTLYFLTDATPSALGWLMAGAALVTVLLVVDTVLVAGAGRVWAAGAGAAYALLPATVLYSLFPYSTTVTALFAMVTVWGVARSRRWHGYGLAISAIGMVGLFLTRASFAWWVLLGWFVALAVLAWRRRRRDPAMAAGGAVLGAVLGLGLLSAVLVQGHYLLAFGIPTLSSWSGENVSNALIAVGLSDDAKARLSAQDPCFAQLIAAQAWGPVDVYGPCLDPTEPVRGGTPVLDQLTRSGPVGGINYNAGARLALADDWSRFAAAALREEPTAVWRVVTGSAEREGSLARFLGRSDVYFETLEIPKATAPALWSALGWWSAVFPWLAWALVLATAAASLTRRVRTVVPSTFWFASALLVLHAVPSIIGDYGENQRFRAELDPVLLAAAAIGLWALVTALRGGRAGAVTPPGSPPSRTSEPPADPRSARPA